MDEWGVVVVIIALVGLIISIVTPLIKLNTSITKLNTTIQNLDSLVSESRHRQEVHEAESNRKFEDYEHRLTTHTVKIKNLERAVFKNNNTAN